VEEKLQIIRGNQSDEQFPGNVFQQVMSFLLLENKNNIACSFINSLLEPTVLV